MNSAAWETELKRELFSPLDTSMIRCLIGTSIDEGTADILFEKLDIDGTDALKLLLMAIIGQKNNWEYYPRGIIPRLKGIYKYYQVQNATDNIQISAYLKALNELDVPVLLSGGIAFRMHYLKGIPRLVSVNDFTVPSSFFEKADRIIEEICSIGGERSADPHRPVIKLHKGTPDKRLFNEHDVWEMKSSLRSLGENVFALSFEHQLLQHMCIPFGYWMLVEKHMDRVLRLSESIMLMENANMELLKSSAERAGLEAHLHFILKNLKDMMCSGYNTEDNNFTDKEYHRYITEFGKLCRAVSALSTNGSLTDKMSMRFHRKCLNMLVERNRHE